MSFEAYLENIKTKTGKTPADFKKLAQKENILRKDMKAGDLVKWLQASFALGHGHSMALWKYFNENGWIPKQVTTASKTVKPVPAAGSQSKIDEYIAGFPADIQVLLEKMRTTIHKAAPEAEEAMAYGIPTFKLNGNLVHFAGYKNHIGFYPAPSAIKAFEKELSIYEGAKGSVQFPVTKTLPLSLVTKMVKFRVKENLEKRKK